MVDKPKLAAEVKAELVKVMAEVDKEKPDPAAVAKLKELLDVAPALLETLGNLAFVAEHNLLVNTFAHENSTRIAVVRYLEQMRDDLGYAGADPLERSLIAHVTMCWARLYDCELRYHTAFKQGQTFRQDEFWERKLSYNQRRFLKASETLARVRRLMSRAEPKADRTAFNLLLAQQIGKR